MKTVLEREDIQAIGREVTQEVIKALQPLFKGRSEDDKALFTVKGLHQEPDPPALYPLLLRIKTIGRTVKPGDYFFDDGCFP